MMATTKYKDSGTKGIGLIPLSWDSQPLVIFFAENRKANSNLESVTALQFKYGEIIQKPSNGRDLNDKDKDLLSKYTLIKPGDVVVNGLNLNFDLKSLRIAIARENGIITSAYIVLRPRNGVNSEYYNYVLKALDFQKILHGMGEGIRLTLSYDELKKINVPAPAASIQSAIVDYLNEKCGEIDSLIGLQEQMIEALKAYKQSVITEAVTKGIRNEELGMRNYKPSGMEWIGEIPEGWKVSRLKYFSNFINGFAFSSDSFTLDNGCKVIRIGDISQCLDFRGCVRSTISTTTLQPYRINNNDIVIAMSGATTGKCCIAKEVEEAYINQRVGIIRSNNYLHIFYQLQTDYFLEYIKLNNMGSAQPNISSNSIGNFPLLVPPLSEQRAIASYLDEKCAEIDELIAIKQQKVEALKEYKKSVIYEAVTGKFKC